MIDLEIKFSDGQFENIDINRVSVDELLKNFGIDSLEVIVKRDGSVILDDEILEKTDIIKIIRVIHGG